MRTFSSTSDGPGVGALVSPVEELPGELMKSACINETLQRIWWIVS